MLASNQLKFELEFYILGWVFLKFEGRDLLLGLVIFHCKDIPSLRPEGLARSV